MIIKIPILIFLSLFFLFVVPEVLIDLLGLIDRYGENTANSVKLAFQSGVGATLVVVFYAGFKSKKAAMKYK
jgi:hypothetical protein